MNGKYVLDTNAILYYLKGIPAWVDYIDNMEMPEWLVSTVSKIELLSYPGLSQTEEECIRRFLDGIKIVPLEESVEDIAIAMRRAMSIKLPDAIVAATAVSQGATLITGDKKLKIIEWPSFNAVAPGDHP
jgi:predicted nucleic acid-binding protein